jgi:hypothetical protein
MFWHLENQLPFLCNYASETVKHTVMGFKEYSGQNTEDRTHFSINFPAVK